MMSESIKLVMVKRNMSGKDLAEALGCTTQNVYSLLKKDNWTESQLQKVAEKLNCRLDIGLVLNDTEERF